MKNTAIDNNGDAIYDLHYNQRKKTIRVTFSSSKQNIVKVSNPTRDEIDYFIFGSPTDKDVKTTFLS